MATNRWISAAFPCNGQIAFCHKNSHPLFRMQFFLFKCHQSLQKCTQMEFKNCYKVNINEMRKKNTIYCRIKRKRMFGSEHHWSMKDTLQSAYCPAQLGFLCQVPQPAIFASNVELTSEVIYSDIFRVENGSSSCTVL